MKEKKSVLAFVIIIIFFKLNSAKLNYKDKIQYDTVSSRASRVSSIRDIRLGNMAAPLRLHQLPSDEHTREKFRFTDISRELSLLLKQRKLISRGYI